MSKQLSRVLVFGHSVALAIRSPRESRDEGNYADLLRRHLKTTVGPEAEVVNLALRSNMVDEDDLVFTSQIQRHDPDVVILHYGISECAPRLLPRWLWMFLYGFSRQGWLKRKVAWITRIFEVRLMRLIPCKGWISAREFGECLAFKVENAKTQACARVMLMNVGPPSDSYRRMLPGVERQIAEFNKVIADVARQCGADLVDVHAMVSEGGVEALQPDGCHLSVEGHRRLFEIIRGRFDQMESPAQ